MSQGPKPPTVGDFGPTDAEAEQRARPLALTDPRVLIAFVAIVVGALSVGFALRPSSPGNDSVEAGYARDMIQHHTQAISMAETIRGRTQDDTLRTLAVDIELTQQFQVGQMQGWLDQWRLPATGTQQRMAWMGMPTTGLMPGMATQAQLASLGTLPEADASTTFLQLMIVHHQAAIDMSRAILPMTDRSEIRTFAQKVIDSQTAEIAQMETMLKGRGAAVPEHPAMASMGASGSMSMDGAEGSAGFASGIGEAAGGALRFGPLVIGGFALVWLVFDTASRRSPRPYRSRGAGGADRWRVVAVVALLASALIHAALAPEHFAEAPLFGWFFVLSTVALVAAAGGISVYDRGLPVRVGLLGLAGLIALYLMFRVIPPPTSAEPETFDLIGLVTQAVQVIGLAALVVVRARTRPHGAVHPSKVAVPAGSGGPSR